MTSIANTTVIAKVAAVVAGLGLVATSFAIPARAATTAELEAQIAALQAQLGGSTTASACTFTRDLTVGSQGADVTCLQTQLAAKGYFTVAPTGYFGTVTAAAVAKWQAAAGITPAAGYFGPISRAKFAAMGGSTGGSTGGNTGGSTGDLSGGEADLTNFDFQAEDSSGDEGEEGVELATAEFDVEDADARVERAELTFEAASSTLDTRPWNYFDTIYVMVDGKEVADVDASDRDEWDETTDDVYVISLTGLDVTVEEGETVELMFTADIASSIDDADQDQTFDIEVDTEGIRAVDGDGIQQYVGDGADEVSFGFGAEDNGDLQIKSSSEDPDSSVLVADADDESDDYSVFAFTIENDGDSDSLVTEITVDVATGTAALTDMVRTATLMIDGEEIDGDITNATGEILFEDIDVEVAADDELEVEVMVTLKANASAGTIDFSVAAADVEAEGVDSGDESDVSGSANGSTHTVALTGIAVEAVSTSETVTTPGSTASDTYATYTIKFDVTALEDDAYIADLAASTSAAGNGAEFTIIGGTYAGPAASVTLTSTADLDTTGDDYFLVREGDTETFTLTVTLNPTTAGTFGVRLTEINFNDTAADGDTTFTVDSNNADFRTDNVYIAN